MTKTQIVNKILKILESLYPEPTVPLLHRDSYTLLIAVVLSAHCTDARVNQVTPNLFAKASNPKEMVELGIDEIKDMIRICGLSNRKAQAIWELSHILIDRFNGQVPADYEALESLPGVGHKTASVVMAQAFRQNAFPVDTHIHRCAKRWGLSSGKNVGQTEKDLKALFPEKKWNRLHLQIIYFAREYCQARKHTVETCPICSWLPENNISQSKRK